MSRVTVEDCLEHVGGYFELAHIASKRAVQLSNGANPLVDNQEKNKSGKKEKVTVTALCEIAEGLINEDFFRQELENRSDQKLQVADWIRVAQEKNEQQTEEI